MPLERGRDFSSSVFNLTSAKTIFSQTPGRPTPPITDRSVSTVTLGWVGDLHQRIRFRFHEGVVGFVDRCVPRILIKVGSSLQSLPEQGFYIHCAAHNQCPRKLSRDVLNVPCCCTFQGFPLLSRGTIIPGIGDAESCGRKTS